MENPDSPLERLDFKKRQANQTIPRNLENVDRHGLTSVKCYRNSIYVLLFHTPVLLNYITDHHIPICVTENCQICRFLALANRFFAPDKKRLWDQRFNADVDSFWEMVMLDDAGWEFDRQNDPMEYMDKMLEYFEHI